MAGDISWKSADKKIVDFIFSQAEKNLDAQIKVGIASDQRAISAASMFIGFSGAIIAASIAYWSASHDIAGMIGGLVCGFVLWIASGFCFWAARPILFHLPGNQPENWYSCLKMPLVQSKGVEIENYQQEIDENEKILRGSALFLKRGFFAAFSSPILGCIFYITMKFLFPV